MRRRRLLHLVLVCALSLLPGCGGSSSAPEVAGSGGVSFRIRWPAAERLIPNASESIAVGLTYADTWSQSQIAAGRRAAANRC